MKKRYYLFAITILILFSTGNICAAENIPSPAAGASSVLAAHIRTANKILIEKENKEKEAKDELEAKKEAIFSEFQANGINIGKKTIYVTSGESLLYSDKSHIQPTVHIASGTIILSDETGHIDTISASGYSDADLIPYSGEEMKQTVSISSYARLMKDENGNYIGYIFPGEKAKVVTGNTVSFMGKTGTVTDMGEISEKGDCNNSYIREQEIRRAVIEKAISKEGKIPYVWGGKPDKNGDYTYGLDCSGFISYCMQSVAKQYSINIDVSSYQSTKMIGESFPSSSHLKPGDLCLETGNGTYYTDVEGRIFSSAADALSSTQSIEEATGEYFIKGSFTHADHVGIYVGHTKDGCLFCHENGKADNVSVNDPGVFTVFRVPDIYKE